MTVAVEHASELLSLLRGLVPFDACALTAWDATSGTDRHRIVLANGYEKHVLDHFSAGSLCDDPEFPLPGDGRSRVMRWRDVETDADTPPGATVATGTLLRAAGFREGAIACLRTAGGRYTGALHIGWRSRGAATEERCSIIERFLPLLATACDVLREPLMVADVLAPDAFVLLLSPGAAGMPVPGRPAGLHLGIGGALRDLVASRWPDRVRRRFLWIDPAGGWHRVELVPCRSGTTLLTEHAVDPPYGLTARELQILHLVAAGVSNPQVAERLFVSVRTVSTHLEHIFAKLSSTSRTRLAAIAIEEGLLLAESPDVHAAVRRVQVRQGRLGVVRSGPQTLNAKSVDLRIAHN